MKRLIWTCLILLLVMLTPGAQAQDAENPETLLDDVGFEQVEQLAESIGISDHIDVGSVVRSLIAGDSPINNDVIQEWFASFKNTLRHAFQGVLIRLAVPVLAGILLRILLGGNRATVRALNLFCRIACAGILTELFITSRSTAGTLMALIVKISNVVTPVMISAVTLTGATTTASILSPMAALCAGLIENFLCTIGLALCGGAAAVAMAGNLSEHFSLNKLFKLLKGILNWTVGILMTAFMGILSVQGLLGTTHDSAAVRTVRYAVESIVPVIGGEVSDTMDSLVSSAMVMKSAVGVTGMLLVLTVCLEPILSLAASMLSLKLAAAIIEPAADKGIANITEQFGDVAEMLLAACIGCAVLVFMLLGACLTAAGNIVR